MGIPQGWRNIDKKANVIEKDENQWILWFSTIQGIGFTPRIENGFFLFLLRKTTNYDVF